MRSFEFLVDDTRYSVPTLTLVTVRDEARAREWAEKIMAEPYCEGVEVREGGRRRFALGARAARDPRQEKRPPEAPD